MSAVLTQAADSPRMASGAAVHAWACVPVARRDEQQEEAPGAGASRACDRVSERERPRGSAAGAQPLRVCVGCVRAYVRVSKPCVLGPYVSPATAVSCNPRHM
jgi:hypothetical protein